MDIFPTYRKISESSVGTILANKEQGTPTTAIMAWLVLDEEIFIIDIVGLLIAAIGVYIATRK